jgi:beta-lactam-binding protein with PASTA domain
VTTPPSPSVTSVVPTPPKLVRVPGVVGERRAAAEAILRQAGFSVSVRLVPAPSARDVRRVIAQLPAAGQQARPGSVVVLSVGDR